MKNSTLLLGFLSVLTISLGGCGGKPEPSVVCTTSIIADAAKRIAGPHLKVDCLLGPGVDPHKHKPSAGDIGKLASAKLVLYNGLHLEGKMVDLLEKPQSGHKAVAVTKTLDPHKELRQAEVDGGAHDPHVWFDVKLWKKCVVVIRDELCEFDPAHAGDFRKNADDYLKELDTLDAEVRTIAAGIPANRRILVTSHDAFGYFGAAYGFEVHGLQGVSTASETSLSEVKTMVDLIAEKKIPAVFTETSVPPAGLLKVIEGVKAKSQLELKVVGDDEALYSDALGEPGSAGATYPGMVRHNITVLAKYLK